MCCCDLDSVRGLWEGEFGYRMVADFKAPNTIARNLIPGLSSRILILTRHVLPEPADGVQVAATHPLAARQ